MFARCVLPITSQYTSISVVGKIKCVDSIYKTFANKVSNKIIVCLFILLQSTCSPT